MTLTSNPRNEGSKMLMRRFRASPRLVSTIFMIVLLTCFCLYNEYRSCPKHTLSSSSSSSSSMLLSSSNNVENKPSYKLAIVVLSRPNNIRQRETIRHTWLYEKYKNVKHFFVIGTLSVEAEQLQNLIIEKENQNDLLLLEDLKDSYGSLTKKLLSSLKRIYEGFEFRFLLKCDDDSYVVIDKLLTEIDNWEAENLSSKELYWGFFNGKAQVKRNGPWKETEWILCDFYLPYALGGGYVLSQRLVQFITENSEILKMYNSEDISVGLWLAPLSNIERKHDVRFDTEYKSRGCSNEYIVTHKQTPENMQTLYRTYENSKTLCLNEVRHRNSYRYDWSVPPSKCCVRQPGIP